MDKKQFKKAFEICKTNKLDMNLLFDMNPQKFIENNEEFIK